MTSDAPSLALRAAKQRMREEVRTALLAIAPAAQREAGVAIAALLADRLVATGGPVALFASMAHELDTAPLDAALRARGVPRAYPTVEEGALVFRVVAGDIRDLPRQGFGIPAPPPDLPRATPSAVVVPGLAFDLAGRRLGHGKGYYDRALAAVQGAFVVGVLLDVQRVAAVPTDALDVRLPFTCSPAAGLLDHRAWTG